MVEYQVELVDELKKNGASLVGFGNVEKVQYRSTARFPTAISMAAAYEIDPDSMRNDENLFHHQIKMLDKKLNRVIGAAEKILSELGVEFEIIPNSIAIRDNDHLENLDTFSHKAAATCAGLGWIGKCALLITPEFGPRLRLGTILTNADFETGRPIMESRCGDCTLCVQACPYKAVKSKNWNRGAKRSELIDAYLCNRMRMSFISRLGRKSSCGHCLLACPEGL